MAVVGPSGSGKSTIGRLLFRFYDVTGGRGADRRAGPARRDASRACGRRSAWCRRTRCSSTTRSATTSPTAAPRRRRAEVEAAARAAQIHDFVTRLPHGYDTTGRRARAEALGRREAAGRHRAHAAEGPADPAARRGDERARHRDRARHPGSLRAMGGGRSVITIAHRLSTVVDADRIVVLEHGPRRRAGHPRGAARARRALRPHVGAPARRARPRRHRRRLNGSALPRSAFRCLPFKPDGFATHMDSIRVPYAFHIAQTAVNKSENRLPADGPSKSAGSRI